jgi:glycolate oxidase iron-sulfur subunit
MHAELADTFRDAALGRESRDLLQACVQCGQCTFTCPTFRLLGDEWDGPRGRIYLIKQFLEGREPDPTFLPPAYSLQTLVYRMGSSPDRAG